MTENEKSEARRHFEREGKLKPRDPEAKRPKIHRLGRMAIVFMWARSGTWGTLTDKGFLYHDYLAVRRIENRNGKSMLGVRIGPLGILVGFVDSMTMQKEM